MNRQSAKKTNRQSGKNGFTLIELLISIALLSSILLLGNYSYSLFADKWQKQLGNFNQQAQQAKSFALLKMLIEGITPLVITDDNNRPVVHFDGGISGLVGSSFNGVISNHAPVYFELVYEATEQGLGNLVYYQIPSNEFLLVSTSQYVDYQQRTVLISDIKNATFRYRGYTDLDSLSIVSDFDEKKPEQQWFDAYSGNQRQMLPGQIELMLEFAEQKLMLNFSLMNTPETFIGFSRNSSNKNNSTDDDSNSSGSNNDLNET